MMQSHLRFLLLIGLPLVVLGACPNKCGGRGYCDRDDECHCASGYYNSETIKDCSYGLADIYPTGWRVIQGICATIWGTVFIVCIIGAYYVIKKVSVSKKDSVTAYETKYLLVITSVNSLSQCLIWSIDYGGYHDILPWTVVTAFHYAALPTTALLWIGTLFHWADIYRFSLKSLKKDKMLKAINEKYKGIDVTLTYVTSQVKFLQSLRAPFFVIVGLYYVVELTCMSFGRLYLPVLSTVRAIFSALFWFILLLGFIIYGRKLTNIMPPGLIETVRKTTRKVTWLSCVILITFIGGSIAGIWVESPESYIALIVFNNFATCAILMTMLTTFMTFHSSFPYCWGSKAQQTRSSEDSTAVRSAPIQVTVENSGSRSDLDI